MTRLRLLLLIALLLAVPGARAFVYYMVGSDKIMRWNLNNTAGYHTNVVNPVTKKIRYFVASDLYSNSNRVNELNAIRAAFDQWQSIPGAKIGFEEAGFVNPGVDLIFDNTNVVFWAKNSLIVGGGENISGRRGWTSVVFSYDDGRILEADIVLNGVQNQWFTDINHTENVSAFVEIVMLHEIGHFLGLDHTPLGGGTVLPGHPGISPELGLSSDEIAAMRFLYPDPALKWGSIKGKVTMNGAGILGAIVALQDSNGTAIQATVTRDTGDFELHSLEAGTYTIRVSPLDPAGTPNSRSLLRGEEIAIDYQNAVTAFKPTPAIGGLTLTNGQNLVTNIAVASGNPPFRISSISMPTTFPDLVSIARYCYAMKPGQSNYYLSVNGQLLTNNSTLSISGDGITMGPTVFKLNRFQNLNTLTAGFSVSSNATPGLRTLIVQNGTNYAYAHGYLEISPLVEDFNFDGFDDRFQRQYWSRWTTNAAAPKADPDGDGFSNEYEYRTGTNPVDSSSYSFLIDQVQMTTTASRVSFTADVGKRYQLHGRLAFAPDSEWEPVGGPVTARSDRVTVEDSAPAGERPQEKFYRLELLE